MSHYNGIPDRSLQAIAREHGISPAPDRNDLITQLLENDVAELAKEKGVSESGLPRVPPRLPQYNKHSQMFEVTAFVAGFALWSIQNRDILDRYAEGLRLISYDEHLRLQAYVRAEDAFIAPKEEQNTPGEAIKRWHTLLDAAKEVGIYVYEYRHVENPMEDRCTEAVRYELYDALEQARTDRIAMLESRRRIAEEKARIAAEKAKLDMRDDGCDCCIVM